MFIVRLTYKKPLAEVERHLAAHREYLDRHYADGAFLCSGPQNPRSGGI
ncbi:MAG: YciI family protein, partial [Alistipes senegalensis]